MSDIVLPEILNIPPKLIPMVTRFNEFDYFLLEGGRGCISGDTEIDTPRGKIRVDKFKGGEVFSFDGEKVVRAYACRPIKYTIERLFKVSFKSGNEITCTDEHKFATMSGWKMLKELSCGSSVLSAQAQSALCLPQTTSDTSLSELHEDVRHSLRTLAGSIYRYWQDYCQCGGRLPKATDTFRDVFQQLIDVEQHTFPTLSQMDAKDIFHKDDLQTFSRHLSNLAFLLEAEGKSYKGKENCISEISSELLSVSFELSEQSLSMLTHHEQAQALSKQLLRLSCICTLTGLDKNLRTTFDMLLSCVEDKTYSELLCCNLCHHHNKEDEIVNIVEVEKDYYYDFFVPFYNNYLSNGVINHNSGKSATIARFILYICSIQTVRCFCVREVQNSIEDSVYQLLVDTINQFQLDFEIQKAVLRHRVTGSTIKFKGLREQGKDNIKSLEGANIVWVEEAQSISKAALDTLLPTIRKNKSRMFFSMNRFIRTDAVYEAMAKNPRCLTIHIDYFDNPWCPRSLIVQAETCKAENPKDYNHIWLGEPLDAGDDYLFSATKLDAMLTVLPDDKSGHYNKRVLSIDLSGAGGDSCVAKVLYMRTGLGWCDEHTVTWSNPDTDYSIGRCIALHNEFQPNEMIVDACGIGYPMFVAIRKVIPDCIGFNGAETEFCEQHTGNHRAQSYLDLKELIDSGRMRCEDTYTRKDLEGIRRNFARKGKIYLISKQDMRKDGLQSPDRGDALAMGAFAIKRYFGQEKDFAPAYDIMQNGREVYADTSEWRL